MKPPANIDRHAGWTVSVQRTEGRVRKYFGDARWGGRAKALAQSIAYRDTLLRQLPPSQKVTRPLHRHTHIERVGSWTVRIKRRGKVWSRQFADGLEGPAASLARARAWRGKMLKRVPPFTKLKTRFAPNRTGKVGVAFTTERQRNGRILQRYVATWPLQVGERRKATFSITKYGKQEALRLAAEARDKGVAELLLSRKRNPPVPSEPTSGRTTRSPVRRRRG